MEKDIKVIKEDLEKVIELKKEDIGEIPEGTKTITENGVYNVGSYASADVQVPGIVPSGELSITSNNTYDVTQYASANVNVPIGVNEINDGSYLFNQRSRLDKKVELMGILKNPVNTKYMFNEIYNVSGSGDDYVFDIRNINFSNNTNMEKMFAGNQYGSLNNFKGIENMNTSNVTSLSYVFDGLARFISGSTITSDITLDLTNWNTSNVQHTNYAFQSFYQAVPNNKTITLDLSNWNLSSVTTMQGMFSGCRAKIIKMTNWSSPNCTSYNGMFESTICDEIDLSSMEQTVNCNTANMFRWVSNNLSKIDMRKFDFSKATSYSTMFGSSASSGVPNNCLIIVKDNDQKTWITSKFSRLTNVKTVAEL